MFRDIYLDQRLNYAVDYFDKKRVKMCFPQVMVGHFESTELPEDINEPGQHGEAGAKKKVNNISS